MSHKYRAIEVSFRESVDSGQRKELAASRPVNQQARLKGLLDANPESIYLEISGYSLDEDAYEGLLSNAPHTDGYDIEGEEENWASCGESLNPLEAALLSESGPPTVRWLTRIEWSDVGGEWRVTEETR